MPREIPAVLVALAFRYREAKAGREGSSGDFVMDFRDLLDRSDSCDGDARESAEEDLLRAAHESGGLLSLDVHAKDRNIIHRVRLSREGGAAWLFSRISETSPEEERQAFSRFFQEEASREVPAAWSDGWSRWMGSLSERAALGKSVKPFERGDNVGNSRLLRAIRGVLHWQEESLIRYASVVICGDSKALEVFRPRLVHSLREISGDASASLETFRILDVPRSVWVHGPLVLHLPGGPLDLGLLGGPVMISAVDLEAALSVESAAPFCLTVENEGVFRELAKRGTGVLLVHTSFPGAAARLLFRRLPVGLCCHHFGDSDPAGFDILRDLREKTGRDFRPVLMGVRASGDSAKLSPEEQGILRRLLGSGALSDLHGELQSLLDSGSKGEFEQEAVALSRVLAEIEMLKSSGDC